MDWTNILLGAGVKMTDQWAQQQKAKRLEGMDFETASIQDMVRAGIPIEKAYEISFYKYKAQKDAEISQQQKQQEYELSNPVLNLSDYSKSMGLVDTQQRQEGRTLEGGFMPQEPKITPMFQGEVRQKQAEPILKQMGVMAEERFKQQQPKAQLELATSQQDLFKKIADYNAMLEEQPLKTAKTQQEINNLKLTGQKLQYETAHLGEMTPKEQQKFNLDYNKFLLDVEKYKNPIEKTTEYKHSQWAKDQISLLNNMYKDKLNNAFDDATYNELKQEYDSKYNSIIEQDKLKDITYSPEVSKNIKGVFENMGYDNKSAYNAWNQAKQDALREGIQLSKNMMPGIHDKRTTATQADIKARNPGNNAAKPGESPHEFGMAWDVQTDEAINWLKQNGAKYGLYQVFPDNPQEIQHFEYRPSGMPKTGYVYPPQYVQSVNKKQSKTIKEGVGIPQKELEDFAAMVLRLNDSVSIQAAEAALNSEQGRMTKAQRQQLYGLIEQAKGRL